MKAAIYTLPPPLMYTENSPLAILIVQVGGLLVMYWMSSSTVDMLDYSLQPNSNHDKNTDKESNKHGVGIVQQQAEGSLEPSGDGIGIRHHNDSDGE